MNSTIDTLVERILKQYSSLPSNRRLLIAIAGVPGSGKSTLAYPLVDALNDRLSGSMTIPHSTIDQDTAIASPPPPPQRLGNADQGVAEKKVALAVGLDGWHHTRAELDQFPEPSEARRRRGAAFTFDSTSYIAFIHSLRATPLSSVPYRTFSHSLKDPQPSPLPIGTHQRIVVIEGLYTLLNVEPWVSATKEMDLKLWVGCEKEVARSRLVERHLLEGVETEVLEAEKRVDESDMLNGEWIKERLWKEDLIVIESKEDTRMAPKTSL